MRIREYQNKITDWLQVTFGTTAENITAYDVKERGHRYCEESLECLQSLGVTKEEVLLVVDYVYSRPVGELKQEIGGSILTLSALCDALKISLEDCAVAEYNRANTQDMIERIRHKNANKPKFSPLPGKAP